MLRFGSGRARPAPATRANGTAAPGASEPGGGAGAPRPPRWPVRLAATGVALLGFFALLEVGVRILSAYGLIRVPAVLAKDDPFWDSDHPRFGVWHRPEADATQPSHSFNVRYRTNSLGARDVEHAPKETRPRLVALGDSYLEGWGVEQERRVTDLLETSTGREVVNLAMSHFGPYQELLAYREFAPQFEHDAVLVGIVPMNDFFDLDLAEAKRSPDDLDRYRPYLTGSFPDYRPVNLRESAARRFLRRESMAFSALASVWDSLGRAKAMPAAGRIHSFYYDYSRKNSLLLRWCLAQIAVAAENRPVVVVLIPSPPDFVRYGLSGEPPLTRELEEEGRADGFRVIDLLPLMAAHTDDTSAYFFDSDYHWNEAGHAAAAELLAETLREIVPAKPGPGDPAGAVQTATASSPR
jgi:hypothetical protein